ncbi:basic amino acid ABC transporter substrate-binding protein [Pengzhenrongella frigida]|uniref:basic amino acid ABC transporter substrate-binding protein n=1 Tax=Pengzhenrongella frigida TaxID=1259133 RepID=UPI001F5D52BF|nr:basic amino acid ABC transporter substrate-binding protein [Cellulomonas sp. HLT2-17]
MRIRTRRTGTLIVVTAVAALALSSCASSDDTAATGTGGVPLISEGKLTTCTQLPYRPFEFSEGGEITGFDIDIVAEIAKDLGVEQEVVDTPFEGTQSGEDLNTGKCDIAAAGITITEKRAQALDFSDPYFDATQALMVKSDSTIASLDDLDGKKLGVQAATTGEIYAQENAPGAELVQFEDLALLQTAVQTGQVDAAINDNGVLFDFASLNDDVKVSAEFDTGEQYGLGVKLGSTALLEAVNGTLERIKGDGTYDTLYAKYFGSAPASS